MRKLAKVKSLTIYFSLLVVAFSCSEKLDDDTLGDKSLFVKIQLPAETTSVESRSVGKDVAINSASIIVYASASDDSSLPKCVNEIVLPADIVHEAGGVCKILAFSPNDNILVGDMIYVVFNKELANLELIAKGDIINAFKLSSGNLGAGLVDLNKGLPMYGNSAWLSTGSPTIKIKRAVAKMQLKLDYDGGVNVPGSLGTTYTIEKTTYKLYQLSGSGYLDGSSVGSTSETPISVIDGADIAGKSAGINDHSTGASYIFAFPYASNAIGTPLAVLDSKKFSASRVAMIMKNEMADGSFQYHRLDIYDHLNRRYIDVKNNYHYSVRVREVSQRGYATASDALNNLPSNVDYDIIVVEDGTAVSNGQYVLNVDPVAEVDFTINDIPTTIKLADMVRITSGDAPISTPTALSARIEYIGERNGFDIITNTPTELADVKKDFIVSVHGYGVVTFRYVITLGNIDYTSNIITITSKIMPKSVEGFSTAKRRFHGTVESGFEIYDLYNLPREFYNVNTVESFFNKDWDGLVSNLRVVANKAVVANHDKPNNSSSVTLTSANSAYFHPFSTSPGEADIESTLKIEGKSIWGTPFSYVLPLTIITSCRLPNKADGYGVKIKNIKSNKVELWADRNVAAAMPTGDLSYEYELSHNYTNESGHPDNYGFVPSLIIPPGKIVELMGQRYKWSNTSGGSFDTGDAKGKCETMTLGGVSAGAWKLPSGGGTGNSVSDSFRGSSQLYYFAKQIRGSKYRYYIVTTEHIEEGEDNIGAFLPLGGHHSHIYPNYNNAKGVFGLYPSVTGGGSAGVSAIDINNITKDAVTFFDHGTHGWFLLRCVRQLP